MKEIFVGSVMFAAIFTAVLLFGGQEKNRTENWPSVVRYPNGREVIIPRDLFNEGDASAFIVWRNSGFKWIPLNDLKESDIRLGWRTWNTYAPGMPSVEYIFAEGDQGEPAILSWLEIKPKEKPDKRTEWIIGMFREDGSIIGCDEAGTEAMFKGNVLVGIRVYAIYHNKRIAEREYKLPTKEDVAPKKD